MQLRDIVDAFRSGLKAIKDVKWEARTWDFATFEEMVDEIRGSMSHTKDILKMSAVFFRDEGVPKFSAMTLNGPTQEVHAIYIAAMHNTLPLLLEASDSFDQIGRIVDIWAAGKPNPKTTEMLMGLIANRVDNFRETIK